MNYKLLLLGDGGVGKTEYLQKLKERFGGVFVPSCEYESTLVFKWNDSLTISITPSLVMENEFFDYYDAIIIMFKDNSNNRVNEYIKQIRQISQTIPISGCHNTFTENVNKFQTSAKKGKYITKPIRIAMMQIQVKGYEQKSEQSYDHEYKQAYEQAYAQAYKQAYEQAYEQALKQLP
jgi:hypothetical protein